VPKSKGGGGVAETLQSKKKRNPSGGRNGKGRKLLSPKEVGAVYPIEVRFSIGRLKA